MARRETMGMGYGLESPDACVKRKFRWLLNIEGVSAGRGGAGSKSLPPLRSNRPNLTFKEMEVQHLNETIFFPSKPDWKPITLVLYDLKTQARTNPVFEWIRKVYDPREGSWRPSVVNAGNTDAFKKKAELVMYDGCGQEVEKWVYENAWPQMVEFGELDMGNQEIVTMDLTLRYDRAYVEEL